MSVLITGMVLSLNAIADQKFTCFPIDVIGLDGGANAWRDQNGNSCQQGGYAILGAAADQCGLGETILGCTGSEDYRDAQKLLSSLKVNGVCGQTRPRRCDITTVDGLDTTIPYKDHLGMSCSNSGYAVLAIVNKGCGVEETVVGCTGSSDIKDANKKLDSLVQQGVCEAPGQNQKSK